MSYFCNSRRVAATEGDTFLVLANRDFHVDSDVPDVVPNRQHTWSGLTGRCLRCLVALSVVNESRSGEA